MKSDPEPNTLDKLPPILKQDLDINLCTCMDVPKMEIINAIVNGATTVEEVKKQTSATLGSGCCLQQVKRLIECLCVPPPRKRRYRKKANLIRMDGDDLELQFRHTLENLGKQGGMFRHYLPQGTEQNPGPHQAETLDKDDRKEQWSTLPADVKGDIYEGLLEHNAYGEGCPDPSVRWVGLP